MSVGTDGVLLGAWAAIAPDTANILDVGTGSGLIAFMLAQRHNSAHVTGIDINPEAVETAARNAENTDWGNRMTILHQDIRTYQPQEKFNLIVSNPPYFPAGSLKEGSARALARSFETLTPAQLIVSARKIIAPQGSLAVVIPSDIADDFEFTAWENNLFLARRTDVVTIEGKPTKRKLLQFVCAEKSPGKAIKDTLVLQTSDGKRTSEYEFLTKDFYLDKP